MGGGGHHLLAKGTDNFLQRQRGELKTKLGHFRMCVPQRFRASSSGTHSLRREHFVDGVVVLLSQDGQLPGLLLLQPLEHGLVIRLGCGLQQVVPEGLVLPGLSFTSLLELLLNLKLFRL